MRLNYLCRRHADRIRADEALAFALWREAMQRGLVHYSQCNWHSAIQQLGCAWEIALLRLQTGNNRLFCAHNLAKPFEFLFEIYSTQQDYGQAAHYLDAMQSLSDDAVITLEPKQYLHLQTCRQRLRYGGPGAARFAEQAAPMASVTGPQHRPTHPQNLH